MGKGREWWRDNLFRISLTQILLGANALALFFLGGLGIYVVSKYGNSATEVVWKLDIVGDVFRNGPYALVSIFSGFIGAKARIYMDEMRIAKEPGFNTLTDDAKGKFLREYGFGRHNYLLGVVAAFVAIITLGAELSILHQMVIGILSSMVGSQFLSQRLEGGGTESPNLEILTNKLNHLVTLAPPNNDEAAATTESNV